MKPLFTGLLLLAATVASHGEEVAPYAKRLGQRYAIERVAIPSEINPQVGGMTVLRDGRLAATFHHGEVALLDPAKGTWQVFAEGLHEPLGILEDEDGSLLVMQRAELTRLRDTDGDGKADQFETVWDNFGITGNYHEFAFGPVRGPNGKLYVSLNLASEAAAVRKEIRGDWSKIGLEREKFYTSDWKTFSKKEVGGMYSRVAWRGWVMEIDPKTGVAEPFASGFRSPDGINFDANQNLVIVDQQGDWRGTNEVHVVKRGGFYGHPASLVWRRDWDGSDPLKASIERLNTLRTLPAINLPYATYSSSPTETVIIPKTKAWGAFGGQLVVGEMNYPRLFRLLLENVDGQWQGACVLLAESEELKGGLHRIVFIGDALYVGRIHLAWAGGEGIGVVRPRGEMPFEIAELHATAKGFRFEFTRALPEAARDPKLWGGTSYSYAYHASYGSPKMNKTTLLASDVAISSDGRVAEVALAGFKPGLIYDFDLAALRSTTGEPILNPRIAYTLNRVPSAGAEHANLR